MKKQILDHCKLLVAEKIANLKQHLKDLQDSANEDSKSAMGDKYETGRAMVHLEQENLMTRYDELVSQLELLANISTSKTETIQSGSLVTLDTGLFFISTGLGKIQVNELTLFAIAPNSPIGLKLLGKTVGDQFELNGRHYCISKIE